MYRCIVLIALALVVSGCKSTIEKRVNKDIAGINEQLYDLEKKQIKDSSRVKKLESDVQKISSEKEKPKEDEKKNEADTIYKDGYKQYLDQKYAESIRLFTRLTQLYKDDSLVDNALYWQAESYLKLNQTDQALSHYQMLYRYFPFSNKADYALYKIGLIYQDMKENSKALLAYTRLVNEYTGSDLYKTALVKIKQLKTTNRRR
ncbi:MAG: tetratricopeptide repeat protein [bacterium]|nr:tetratricopeptide repeat protein [bacterium]